jgi:hypothetical protein
MLVVIMDSMTVVQLKAQAKAEGKKGYSKLTKVQLIKLLKKAPEAPKKKVVKKDIEKKPVKKAVVKKETPEKDTKCLYRVSFEEIEDYVMDKGGNAKIKLTNGSVLQYKKSNPTDDDLIKDVANGKVNVADKKVITSILENRKRCKGLDHKKLASEYIKIYK